MRIIYLFFIICLCLVNAKYLPDESASKVLLRQVRSADDVSDISLNSNSNDSDDGFNTSHNDDNEDNSSTSTDLDILEQKRILREQELTRKQEEEKRKHEQKIAEQLCKEEKKRLKEELKRQERLDKEERKRLERIEKERLKQEEIERKRQEKIEKEERKRQKKIIKQLEKLEKESSETEESSESKETDQSLELDDIGKIYIYEKYGLSPFSTELEKKAALNTFLNEELGLNANSTESERRQAIVNIINNNILDETNISVNFKNYVVNHLSAANIQAIEAKIEKKINKLDNETALLNNITLPWVNEAQENVEEKRIFLQALKSLSNLLLKWITGGPQSTSGTISDNFIPTVTDVSLTGSASSDPTTIAQLSSSNVVPAGTEGSVDNSGISSSEPNTETSSSAVNTHITTKPLNPSESTQSDAATTASPSVSSTETENKQTTGFGDTTYVNIVSSSFDSTLPSVTDTIQITSQGSPNFVRPTSSATINDSLNSALPSESPIPVTTTVATTSETSVNVDGIKISVTPSSENNTSGDNTLVNSNTNSDTATTETASEISISSTNTTTSATIVPINNITDTSISGTEPTVDSADTPASGVGNVNSISQEPPAIVNTSELDKPTNSSDVAATTISDTESSSTGSLVTESSSAKEVTGLLNNVPSVASITTSGSPSNSNSPSAIETSSVLANHSISGNEITPTIKSTVTSTEPSVATVINTSGDPLLPVDILVTVSTDVSSSAIEISTPGSIILNDSGNSSTEGNNNGKPVTNVTETIKESNQISSSSSMADSLSTVLNIIDSLITTSTTSGDIISSSYSKPTLVIGDNAASISTGTVALSTEFNQAAVVTDSINTSSGTTQKSVTETGSPDVSTTITESVTTTVSYSDSSSSDITVSLEPQTTVNHQIVTEATNLHGTTIVTLDNVPLMNTGSEAPVIDGVSITDNSVSKGVPTEINTPEVTVSQEPQTTVNHQIVTEATNLDGTTIVTVDNAPLMNTGSEAPVTDGVSITDNGVSKGVPTEINTPETVIVYTERTAPRIIFIPGEPGAKIIDMQSQ